MHGAKLSQALREMDPTIELVGVGGKRMQDAGVSLLPNVDRVDAMGLPGIRQLLKGWKTLRMLSNYVRQERLDAVVLVDSPGLNLRLAKTVTGRPKKIIYYIAPQVWAWGRRRLYLMRKVIDHVLAILPFEEQYFRKAGLKCDYVGHPLLDDLEPSYDRIQERKNLRLSNHGYVIGLLPGSRDREVQKVLPILVEAVKIMRKRYPNSQTVLAQAESIRDELLLKLLERDDHVRIIRGQPEAVMAASDVLLVASGTATLQAALIGTPMVIVYRTSVLTYHIAKRLISIPYVGLVNILANKEVVPELLQENMTASNIAHEACEILEDTHRREQMQERFQAIRASLGEPGASMRAAELILSQITP